jgi:hypothetical protein
MATLIALAGGSRFQSPCRHVVTDPVSMSELAILHHCFSGTDPVIAA